MAERINYLFDLPTLLRLDDLDIRMIARNNLSLLVGDFFKSLSKFLFQAPTIIDTLNKILNQKAKEYDYRSMTEVNKLMESIACYKHMHITDEIHNAGKRGHYAFAADCAKKFIEDLNRLGSNITAAIINEEAEANKETDEDDESFSNFSILYRTHPLKKVLQILDHEESTRKMRILAIDDAPVMLKTISSCLSEEYKVYGMTNPMMLEKFLQQITPELFLLDYQMPGKNGFELIPIIRNFKEHKETPVIFLTSKGTVDHVSAAFALGACDYIVKPFQGNILREKVAKHIVRKKLF